MQKGDEIRDRLVDFAARIIKVCDAIPNTKAGKHIAGQLLRSGTSPAPNHAEARGAESTADFIHKLKIAVKELNESAVWLQIIVKSQMLDRKRLEPVMNECEELRRILGASIRTARNSEHR